VEDLANSSRHGARIRSLVRHGSPSMGGGAASRRHHVVTDRVVSATYLASDSSPAASCAWSTPSEHMEMLLRKIEAMGGVVDVPVRACRTGAAISGL